MPTKSIKKIDQRSLTRSQQRLVKMGSRLVKQARYYWLLLAESHLTRRFFRSMLRRGSCRRSSRSQGVKHVHQKGGKRWNAACGIRCTSGQSGFRSEFPLR